MVASSEDQPSANVTHEVEVEGNKVNLTIQHGDFSEPLQKSINALTEVPRFSPILTPAYRRDFEARKYTANDHQSKMIDEYIES